MNVNNLNTFDVLDVDVHAYMRRGRQMQARAMYNGLKRLVRAFRSRAA